jgi:hypothetical protein
MTTRESIGGPLFSTEREAAMKRQATFERARRAAGAADDPITPRLVQRGAVEPATTSTSGWASQLSSTQVVGDFIASLAPQSAAARLIVAGIKVSLDRANSILFPRRVGGKPATDVPWISQGAPIPALQRALESVQLGPANKIGAIFGMTREQLLYSSGLQTLTTLLTEDAVASLDAAVISTTAASAGLRCAGILNGRTPVTPSAATDPRDAITQDLINLAGAVADAGGSGNVVFIASTRQAYAIIKWLGKDRVPEPVWPCSALTNTVVCVQPDAFLSAFGSTPEISTSDAATIHFNTVPLPIRSGTTTASPVRSSWQEDSISIRCILEAAWALRGGLVSYLTGATWGGP